MKQSVSRSMTVLLLTCLASSGAAVSASASTGEYSFGLDAEDRARFDFELEELSTMGMVDPFSPVPLAPIHPISGRKVERVLVGPAIKTRAYGSGYDFYRYVTYYNTTNKEERIYTLPVHREECHDKAGVFASYNYSASYSSTLTVSTSIEGLGLSSTMTNGRSFTAARNVIATGNTIAEHTPYFVKQSWSGQTLIQLLNSKTMKTEILKDKKKKSPWWVDILFPIIRNMDYPMPFEVKDADWTFTIKRKVISDCATAEPEYLPFEG